MPLKFELGEAFQFDWSNGGMVVGCIYGLRLWLHSSKRVANGQEVEQKSRLSTLVHSCRFKITNPPWVNIGSAPICWLVN